MVWTQLQARSDSEPYLEREGCYLPIFVACMLIVYRRKRKAYKTQMLAMVLLALASTASVIVQCVNQGRALLALWDSKAALKGDAGERSKIVQDDMTTALIHDYAVLGIYIFSNVIADALLLYRCFIIWEKDMRVVLLPVLGFLCNLVLGILGLSYNDEFVFYFWILTIVENIVLTTLITGRIWYINRTSGEILGSTVKTRYNMIAAIILESGSVYSAIVLATSITSMMPHNAILASCMLAAATQVVGIAPCLIIIRVALDVDTRDPELASIAIITSHATQHTMQDPSELQNNILESEEALFSKEVKENTGIHEQNLHVRVWDQFHSQNTGQGKYSAIVDTDDGEDSKLNSTNASSTSMIDSRTHVDDMPTPKPTPNAQQVEFARSDTAVLGWYSLEPSSGS
ncbi:uncharacterized protein C8R40DRAFT_1072462 [Lentinula edodes]|uniref:uncharacterized protein n=1 Tax=Lentinula edodes TaxID=5353 RepID=UPI001E8D93BF|nr:uncharacterized protein C8R40DRAFT_1072462 [Lentinula edodes]KAH7871398.1 hypothetical protein C8R40DRAFT_1072462 [Lentinula edodes]